MQKTNIIAGWSEKVLDFITLLNRVRERLKRILQIIGGNMAFRRVSESDKKLFEPKPGDISDIKCYLSEKAIQYYRSLADEKGELTLSCVCDSTFLFLFQLYKTLELAGFTDITIEDREAKPEEIPKDKPYCSWYYGVTGKLPKE